MADTPNFLNEPPSAGELEQIYMAGLKTLLSLLSADEVFKFKLSLELGLIQPVENDSELLIIPEIRNENEGATQFLDRTKQIPTLRHYLGYFRVNLLQPSEVRHRGNLLGKTGPLTEHAVFLERSDLLRILILLGLKEEDAISSVTFEPKFPDIDQIEL